MWCNETKSWLVLEAKRLQSFHFTSAFSDKLNETLKGLNLLIASKIKQLTQKYNPKWHYL